MQFIKQSSKAFEESERVFLDIYDFENYKNEKGEIVIKDTNFFDLEIIEESFDEMFYEFSQIKSKIAELRKQLFTNDKK